MLRVDSQSQALLKQCGLAGVLKLLREPSQAAVSARPGLSEPDITHALASFNELLFALAYPFFDRLVDVEVREACRARTAISLRDAFARVHAVVADPANGYRAAPRFTPEQVEALLDIPATTATTS